MSSNDIAALKLASQQINVYIGMFSLIVGLLGNTLSIVIFMTLKTFRKTSCAFYLTTASTVNIVQLLSGLCGRILISGYGIDLTKTSPFLCKIRSFIGYTASSIWLTLVCLAVIDQFASVTTRCSRLCNRRLAFYLSLVAMLLWCLLGIPFLIFYDIIVSPVTGLPICTTTNSQLAIYISRVELPVLLGCLPLAIQVVFGAFILINLNGKVGRQAPIVRSRRDKQLTAMVLTEFLVDILLRMPYIVFTLYSTLVSPSDPITITRTELISSITAVCYYSSSTASFIIYCCASSRFRLQLVHVLFHIHLKYWREKTNRRLNRRVAPQSMAGEKAPSIICESVF